MLEKMVTGGRKEEKKLWLTSVFEVISWAPQSWLLFFGAWSLGQL